jgi:hypothetical protein
MVAGYCCQLKTRTQDNGDPLHQFPAANKQSTHCAFLALQENHVRGSGNPFGNGIRDRGTNWQLLMGGKRTLVGLGKSLELEIRNLGLRFLSDFRESVTGMWRS